MQVLIDLGIVDHFAQQENAFARIFFDGTESNFNGVLYSITEAEMPGQVYLNRTKIEEGGGKIFFQLILLFPAVLDITDQATSVAGRNIELLHAAKVGIRLLCTFMRQMNRIDRLFSILTFLQSRKYVPAEKIADKFDISVRTVYRDIKALGESGIPISFEPQRGYFVVQGYFLPPVAFSNEEANALLLTEVLVHGFTDKSIRDHYTTALNKVKTVLRSAQKDGVEALADNIRLQLPQRLNNDSEYLSILQTAIANKSRVKLEYTSSKEETSIREVEPIGLIYYAFSWHLIAWCHLRQDYRDFKVQRIVQLQDIGAAFSIKEHIPLGEFMKQLPVDF